MNKKFKLTVAASALALAALAGGAFAFFSDKDEDSTGATAGTVAVQLSGLAMENKGNINPGDNDPNNIREDDEVRPGTNHDLSFTVENTGNKSIRTKTEITITLNDPTLDASVFALYNCIEQEDGTVSRDVEVVKKYYEVNGQYLSQDEYDALTGNKFCSAVKYVIAGDIFDGVGPSNETEELSTVKVDDKGKAQQSYRYSFAMSADAPDEYQGKAPNINVTVYAVQYRNTAVSNWYVVGSEDLISNGN